MSNGPLDPTPDATPIDDRDALLADDDAFDEDAALVRTGDESVDAVLDEVADLGERPLDEHVGVFERAHEQLRRALDAQPDR